MIRAGFVALVVLLAGCGGREEPAVAASLTVPAHCNAAVAPCEAAGPAGTLTLSLLRPRAMEPFAIEARWSGASPAAVVVGFEMVGMAMGENRYRLQPQGDGRWTATAVLPICVTGRGDWLAVVELESGDGAVYRGRVPFTVER